MAVVRSEGDRQRLDEAFTRFETAQVGGDRQAVSTARLALCRLLEATGWSVPAEVRQQMLRDEKVLRRLAEAEPAALIDGLLRPPSHRFPLS